jgi:hypothetical protein
MKRLEPNQDGRVPVIFRVSRGAVTAVFPAEPADAAGGHMACFAQGGRRTACSRQWHATTRPAKTEEYAALKAELEAPPYGYRLDVRQRVTSEMDDVRQHRARERYV